MSEETTEHILSDLTAEQILAIMPGRHFLWKNKRYECAYIKFINNQKFIITTYTNPVIIDIGDIDEIILQPVVVYKPTVTKRKNSAPKERKAMISYTYLMLVKIVNKPNDISWADLAIEMGFPDSASTLYQKNLHIAKLAKAEELTPNQYIDSTRAMLEIKLKNRIKYNTVKNLEPIERKTIATINNIIADGTPRVKRSYTKKDKSSNIGKLSDKERVRESNEEKFSESEIIDYKEKLESSSVIESSNIIEDSEEILQSKNVASFSNETKSTKNDEKDTTNQEYEPTKKVIGYNVFLEKLYAKRNMLQYELEQQNTLIKLYLNTH